MVQFQDTISTSYLVQMTGAWGGFVALVSSTTMAIYCPVALDFYALMTDCMTNCMHSLIISRTIVAGDALRSRKQDRHEEWARDMSVAISG